MNFIYWTWFYWFYLRNLKFCWFNCFEFCADSECRIILWFSEVDRVASLDVSALIIDSTQFVTKKSFSNNKKLPEIRIFRRIAGVRNCKNSFSLIDQSLAPEKWPRLGSSTFVFALETRCMLMGVYHFEFFFLNLQSLFDDCSRQTRFW